MQLWPMHDMIGGFWIFGMLLMLIFWILVIIGLVLLIRYLWEGGATRRETESALEVLKKRYARGEISKEEFEERKRDLY